MNNNNDNRTEKQDDTIEVVSKVAKSMIHTVSNIDHATQGIVAVTAECIEAMDMLDKRWSKQWEEIMDKSMTHLRDLRMFRVAMDGETCKLMTQLKDVREFFLGDKHDKEVARLKEFIELCERLQKLKQSGFLDTVADTILKLS